MKMTEDLKKSPRCDPPSLHETSPQLLRLKSLISLHVSKGNMLP